MVVAHPDDESFGCGSALLLAGEAGVRTAVVCATRGEAGEPSPLVTDDLVDHDLGTLRERSCSPRPGTSASTASTSGPSPTRG